MESTSTMIEVTKSDQPDQSDLLVQPDKPDIPDKFDQLARPAHLNQPDQYECVPAEKTDLFGQADSRYCAEAIKYLSQLPDSSPDSGWWIMKCLVMTQLEHKFDRDAEMLKRVWADFEKLLNEYYVNPVAYIQELCKNKEIPPDQWETTTDTEVVSFRQNNIDAIKSGDFVMLKMDPKAISSLRVCLRALFSGIISNCGKFKSMRIKNEVSAAYHVPLLMPFHTSIDDLFQSVNMKANSDYRQESQTTGDGMSKVPYIYTTGGHFVLLCDTTESRGVNASGKKFKVLRILDPSASLLSGHFNDYVRKRFPSLFGHRRIAPVMFVQLSETQTTTSVSCVRPYRNNQYHLVFANMGNITMVYNRGSFVPQLHLWVNLKLTT